MPEVVPASGTVHWAGMSTGSNLHAVCEDVVLWGHTVARAPSQALRRLGLTGHAEPAALQGLSG